jgi:TetR/AcrR family transcriptional regulator, transcriptional repressor for nem operon
MRKDQHNSRVRLLDAALTVFRERGYTATRVEDICQAAGLTKGSFFHHFDSKQALAIAAAGHWSSVTDAELAAAPYRSAPSARERLLGYVEQRGAMLSGRLASITCLAGTTIQEVYETVPLVSEAFSASIRHHLEHVEELVARAKAECAPDANWSTVEVAEYTQTVLQGAFVMAKANKSPEVAARALRFLSDYLERLLPMPAAK